MSHNPTPGRETKEAGGRPTRPTKGNSGSGTNKSALGCDWTGDGGFSQVDSRNIGVCNGGAT